MEQETNEKRLWALRWMVLKIAARMNSVNHNPSMVAGLRRVRTWLPGDNRLGDPLSITTRYRELEAVGRRLLGLEPQGPGALHEAAFGVVQIWQWLLEALGRGRGEHLLTIVFTDLVDFSSWALEAGDAEALRLLRDVAEALEPPVVDHEGHVVKHLGDGMMAVFSNAEAALEAVCEGRERLAKVKTDGYEPRLRAGLHTGHPRRLGGDYVGIDVNIAARIAERAAPDEVLASGETVEQLGVDRVEARRKHTLFRSKGVPRDLTMFVLTPLSEGAA